ncbi:MAG TPA: Lrp/AsnC family transcriptional regulator [Bacteroidales bacterium]|nr:Lrp/AsnC family transcriptional regulator [Bacteroidales bacterium]
MTKESLILDNLNWKILEELQVNARISYSEIGRKIGLTGPAVAERVQKLEDAGIIMGYRADINLYRIGYSLTAIINVRINAGSIHSFLKYLKSVKEVYECNRVTGSSSMVIKVAIREPVELEKLVNSIIEYGSPTTSIVLSTPIGHRVFSR